MELLKLNSRFQPNVVEASEYQRPISYTNLFADRNNQYLNEFMLFLMNFNSIPNFIHEKDIDCNKAREWFALKYKSEIKDCHYSKLYFGNNPKQAEYDDVFYILFEDLIVDFDTNQSIVRFLFRNTKIEIIESLIDEIKKFKKPKEQASRLSLLVNSFHGIETETLITKNPKLNLCENYNDEFVDIHNIILQRLSKKNDKGLVLLHGKPGTGKTSYIRYLLSKLKKKVIFLPPSMASSVANPDLMKVLIKNPNSILIIEDAENVIIDREQNEYSPVSSLLNISDGLLSDCLNIQIICSFNVDISKVDSALLRKGRLIAKYEFKELETKKAQLLSNKLGFKTEINAPMTLSAIYNQDDRDFDGKKGAKSIGFRK